VSLMLKEGETTQGPYERGPEFIGMAHIGSGEKLAGRDHRVACATRSPHETALLHPLLHPLWVHTLHPLVNKLSHDRPPGRIVECAHAPVRGSDPM